MAAMRASSASAGHGAGAQPSPERPSRPEAAPRLPAKTRHPEADPVAPAGRGAALEPQAVRRAMEILRLPLRRCMTAAGRRDPSSHNGRVVVRFTVGPEGDVTEATLQNNTTGSPAIGACVLTAAQRLHVDRPRGGAPATVSYPIVYRSQAGATRR